MSKSWILEYRLRNYFSSTLPIFMVLVYYKATGFLVFSNLGKVVLIAAFFRLTFVFDRLWLLNTYLFAVEEFKFIVFFFLS